MQFARSKFERGIEFKLFSGCLMSHHLRQAAWHQTRPQHNNRAIDTCPCHHHYHHRSNVRVFILSMGWTVPPKTWEFVERIFYCRMPFLTSTLPTLEPVRLL